MAEKIIPQEGSARQLEEKRARKREKDRRWRLNNIDRIRAKDRERSKENRTHPEKKVRRLAVQKRYRDAHAEETKAKHAANKDAINAERRAERAANPEKFRAYDRKRTRVLTPEQRDKANANARRRWENDPTNNAEKRAKSRKIQKNNREGCRASEHKSRARRKNAEGFFTAEDIDRIYKAQKGKCALCRVPLKTDFHRDHIIPLSKGGTNWPRNIQLLCQPCNQRKHSKDPIDFARKLGKLL
jgi:5-methylcytosine-specific restriction endonuclease McrA